MRRKAPRYPLLLGLTGGIGSGKSTVAHVLQAMGAHVIDADAVSRSATQARGVAMPEIAKVFGTRFVLGDGSLDRAQMRERVFNDPDARAQLEAIVHPLVGQEIARQIAANTSACLVLDIPLLVENGIWRTKLDLVWVVDCNEETQIQRVHQRSGWDRATVLAVMGSQCPRAQRVGAADAVVFNDGLSLLQLQTSVKLLATQFGL